MWANFCLVRISSSLPLEFYVDSYLPVEVPDSLLEGKAMQVAFQLDPDLFQKERSSLMGMTLRARYNQYLGNGVLLFKTDEFLEAECLEAYLHALNEDELKKTINDARYIG